MEISVVTMHRFVDTNHKFKGGPENHKSVWRFFLAGQYFLFLSTLTGPPCFQCSISQLQTSLKRQVVPLTFTPSVLEPSAWLWLCGGTASVNLLTFTQSHDLTGSRENKLYIYKIFTLFSSCINLHQANINTIQTHKHRNIQQQVVSVHRSVTIIFIISAFFSTIKTLCPKCVYRDRERNTEPLQVKIRKTTKAFRFSFDFCSDRLHLIAGFISGNKIPNGSDPERREGPQSGPGPVRDSVLKNIQTLYIQKTSS